MFVCFVVAAAAVVVVTGGGGGGGGGAGVKELVFSKHVCIHRLEEFSWETFIYLNYFF